MGRARRAAVGVMLCVAVLVVAAVVLWLIFVKPVRDEECAKEKAQTGGYCDYWLR